VPSLTSKKATDPPGILLCAFLTFSCFFNTTVAFDHKPLSLDVFPDSKMVPDAGAFIALDEATVEVVQQDVVTFSEIVRHTVIKVFNEKGYRYANVVIPYDGDSKVSGIQARTILPNGKSITLAKKQIFDTNLFPDPMFYSDLRAKRFTMPAVEAGCILEYRWTKTTHDFTFWTRWAFQQDDPVGVSRMVIRCPNTWEIRRKTYGTDIQPKVENSMKGGKADHVWQLENIPAYHPEHGMPPGNNQVVSILFSPVGVKTWGDIAQWFSNISKSPFRPDASVRAQACVLISDAKTSKEKLKRIYEFVRDHIRYVAIEIGLGGYQAHPAGQVLRNRYGDCKDMVALIAALSESAGIHVEPALAPTWQYGEMDTGLVSLVHFNHLIARSVLPDGSEIWMDATDKTSCFGSLPWYDKDRTVLSVSPNGQAHILRTPKSSASENGIERFWDVCVDSSGKAGGTLSMILRGAPAGDMRFFSRRSSRDDLKNWFGREMLSRFPSGNWEKIEMHDTDSLDKPLRIVGTFSDARCFYSNANGYGFQPGSFSTFDWNRLFPDKNRIYPVQMEYPMVVRDEAAIAFPGQWRTIRNSEKDSLASFFGGFSASWNVTGNRLVYRRCFRVDSTRIEQSEYEGFQNFLCCMAAIDKKTVVFTR
jgi:hypothetical protein